MHHDLQDRVSLELAKRIAAGLPQHPAWIELARANLDRWMRLNGDSPALMRCYAEWSARLQESVHDICRALIAETEAGQQLRQNSPFAGVLSSTEVWEIKRSCRHELKTA